GRRSAQGPIRLLACKRSQAFSFPESTNTGASKNSFAVFPRWTGKEARKEPATWFAVTALADRANVAPPLPMAREAAFVTRKWSENCDGRPESYILPAAGTRQLIRQLTRYYPCCRPDLMARRGFPALPVGRGGFPACVGAGERRESPLGLLPPRSKSDDR